MEDIIRLEIIDNLSRVELNRAKSFQLHQKWFDTSIIDNSFNKLFVVINCNKYVGLCMIANSDEIKAKNELTDENIEGIRNCILGRGASEYFLTDKQEDILTAIGLYFIWKILI